jgi:hypothetical protein
MQPCPDENEDKNSCSRLDQGFWKESCPRRIHCQQGASLEAAEEELF